MAGDSRDGDGEGRWQVRGGRESGCRLVPGKGEWKGKVPWQPVVLGEARGDGDGGGSLRQGSGSTQAVIHKGEKQWCCFICLHHAHPSRLFLPTGRDAQPGWPGVSETQRQEGSGGSWSRDKHCFAQCRPALTAPPSAPRHPTTYKAHRKVLLAPESQSCGGRERGGGAGGGKQGWRASLLLGAVWQAGRLLLLVFCQLGHLCGTTGSSAG